MVGILPLYLIEADEKRRLIDNVRGGTFCRDASGNLFYETASLRNLPREAGTCFAIQLNRQYKKDMRINISFITGSLEKLDWNHGITLLRDINTNMPTMPNWEQRGFIAAIFAIDDERRAHGQTQRTTPNSQPACSSH